MKKKILIASGILLTIGIGYFIYDRYMKEPKGEGSVTAEAKRNRKKIVFNV